MLSEAKFAAVAEDIAGAAIDCALDRLDGVSGRRLDAVIDEKVDEWLERLRSP